MNSDPPSVDDHPIPEAGCPVCFIIPTFNRASALISCLEHLERQTFLNFEVIVIDDGSTDETPQRLEQYQARTTLRLRCLHQENSGPARARNLAVSLTQAPICILIGDDILASPSFTGIHLRLHQDHPDLNIAGLGLTRWNENGQTVTRFMRWMDESGAQFAYHDLLNGAEPQWQHFYTSNLSLKTELLRRNPFNEQFTGPRWMMEDMELGYRLQLQQNLKIVFLPKALAEHIHPTDFRKACRRAYLGGFSVKLFDQLWPQRPVPFHGRLHNAVRDLLCWNSWLLAPLTWFTDRITRFWCPNPLLHPVLAYHAALGRRRAD